MSIFHHGFYSQGEIDLAQANFYQLCLTISFNHLSHLLSLVKTLLHINPLLTKA